MIKSAFLKPEKINKLDKIFYPVYIKGRWRGAVLFLKVDRVGGSVELYNKKPRRYDAGCEIVRGNSTAICLGRGNLCPWAYLGNGGGRFGGDGGKKNSIMKKRLRKFPQSLVFIDK